MEDRCRKGILFCVIMLFTPLVSTHSVESVVNETKNITESSKTFNKLGEHIVAEFLYCTNLNNYDDLESLLMHASEAANATVLGIEKHQFYPTGISGIALLKESHISIHTWPEFDYVAIDIFTCGKNVHTEIALEILKQFFTPQQITYVKLDRGFTTQNQL